ncbi:hypothetical protein ABT56_20670 [Photobacterium aquae]|uniref:Uncharacterized protein n=1 Tax=Photobacterium aquae TaxID=1195763 RepID=A0A0J1GUR5_9GAMM|nr:hypothetical protein [Photobacterium aquae]KLV03169.1 hypothetical protein ABT56_20670 [Photobacterium aquae]
MFKGSTNQTNIRIQARALSNYFQERLIASRNALERECIIYTQELLALYQWPDENAEKEKNNEN